MAKMANKTIDHIDFYVNVKPYTTEGNGDQVFDVLSVSVSYTKGKGFRANYHPGWKTGWGGYGCVFDFSQNPLTAATYVDIDPTATKNNVKRLEQYKANLEQAKSGIAWLFDERMWPQLQQVVKDAALYGYTASLEERIRGYKNERMVKAQVEVKQVDVMGLMNALSTKGRAKLSDFATPIESDNSINENSEDKTMKTNENNIETKNVQATVQVTNTVTTEADVAEVSDIKPRVVRAAVKAANGGPATTMPIGEHGTLVVAGVGGTTKSGKPRDRFDLEKDKSEEPKVTLKRKVAQLPEVRLVVYTTKRGEQAPRIEGFGGENDPRWKRHHDEKMRLKAAAKEADKKNDKLRLKMKGKSKEEKEKLMKQWVSVGSDPFNASIRTDFATGEKTYFMLMGAKYMDAARELVDAYNSGDEQAIAQAEQAVVDVKNGIVAGLQAQREERKAQKSGSAPAADATAAAAEKSYTLDEVAAMLGKLLPQGAASTEDIKKLLKAA